MLKKLRWSAGPFLPSLLQAEAAECGLVCLGMIANYYGYACDLTSLRRRFSLSLKGLTLAQLIQFANQINLAARPLRLELDKLPHLRAPCILHWNLNHFVVLKKAGVRGIEIHDPACGIRTLSYTEASKHFTGIALELVPTPNFERKTERRDISLAALVGQVVGFKRALLQVLALSLGLESLAILAPFFQQWVMDGVIVSHDRDLLRLLTIGLLLLMLIQIAISTLREWLVIYFSTILKIQWVAGLFSHLTSLPMAYFEARRTSDVVSRFGAIHNIQNVLTTTALSALLDGLMTVIAFGVMLVYSFNLAMVSVLAVALYVLIRTLSYRPLKAASEEQIVHSATEQSHFLESIRGLQTIKLFNREDERRAQWLNLVVNTINRGLVTQRMHVLFRTTSGLILGAENILVIYFGALLVMDGTFSIGMLFAYIAYKTQFSSRVGSLVDLSFEIKMLRLQRERLADIVLTEPEANLDIGTLSTKLIASIELRNVRFRYADSEPWVLDGVNLKIEAGESLVIIGPSGCGKTTLLKVLLGLAQPNEGEVLIGGVPLRGLGLRAYRDMLATVMQDDQLFAGSVADNISFFASDQSQQRVEVCAKQAAIHEEIMAMPMGYATLIGDMGTSLSGGQKQRILLARALYKQPRILFLDEATSHLDIEREQQVNEAVRSLHLTRVVIAHRPETIAMARRVVKLESGRISQDLAQAPHPVCAIPITA